MYKMSGRQVSLAIATLVLALIGASFAVSTDPADGLGPSRDNDWTFADLVKEAKLLTAPDARRVVNGAETEPFEYASTVALVIKGETDSAGQACGGTAISDEWILTAAHCVGGLANVNNVSTQLEVLVGGWYLPLELGARLGVCDAVVHPEFVASTLRNDLALLRVCDAHYMPTAALPIAHGADATDVAADAVGWGLNSGSVFSGEQHAASVVVQAARVCDLYAESAYVPYPYDHGIQVCAGGSIDACSGDSGGPLFAGSTVIGITSFGDSPCELPAPGYYVRVSAYVPWIQAETGITPGVTTPGVACRDAYATHVGTAGADSIVTGDRGDVVVALAGDDFVNVGDGLDLVCGGDGADIIGLGGGTTDAALGGGGDDVVYGQAGDDVIDGGDGSDKLRGGPGDDRLDGAAGPDDLNGGSGDDEVLGGDGADRFVRGGTGDDIVDGGPGDDAVVAGNGGSDMVYGGSGDDRLVTGGPRADTVSGGPGNDVVKGHKGADTLHGDADDDMLFGGPQSDVLEGGPGIDDCNGGTTGQGAIESDRSTGCEGEVTAVP